MSSQPNSNHSKTASDTQSIASIPVVCSTQDIDDVSIQHASPAGSVGAENVPEDPPEPEPGEQNVMMRTDSTTQQIDDASLRHASPRGSIEAEDMPQNPEVPHAVIVPNGSTHPAPSPEPEFPVASETRGIVLQKRWKQFQRIFYLCLLTFICVVGTIIFAFLSTSSSASVYFSNPGITIFALQAATTFSVFLLGEMVSDTFDIFRWHRAAHPAGVGVATFFGLGRATSLWGLLRLIRSRQRVGHHKWCIQRYHFISRCPNFSLIFVVSRIVLTFVLLIGINFVTVYRPVTPDHSIIAGAAPFNVTYSTGMYNRVEILNFFSMFLQGLLADSLFSITAPPTTEACQKAGEECYSYILPGDFVELGAYTGDKTNLTDILTLPHQNVDVYVANNVSVYQIEFFPVQNSLLFTDDDCTAYGNPYLGTTFKLCLKNDGNDLVAGESPLARAKLDKGWLACPFNITVVYECFSGPASWNYTLTKTVELRISNYPATVVYSIPDGAIQSVSPSSSPVSSFYSASDLRQIYAIAFNVTSSASPDLFQTLTQVQTMLFTYVIGVIQAISSYGRPEGIESEVFHNLLALPLFVVNYNKLHENGDPLPSDLEYMFTTGHFGRALYRIVIAPATLYVFTVLSVCTLIWCACILSYCWFIGTVAPNMSEYPEFDFASKCAPNPGETNQENLLGALFDGLGNADNISIEKQIKGRLFFVGGAPYFRARGEIERVFLSLKALSQLQPDKKYL